MPPRAVVLGTRTYGAEGRETVDTKKELRFAVVDKKDIVVLKMTNAYAEPYAQMQLDSRQSLWWAPGTPLPDEIAVHIASRVQFDDTLRRTGGGGGDTAPSAGRADAAEAEAVVVALEAGAQAREGSRARAYGFRP